MQLALPPASPETIAKNKPIINVGRALNCSPESLNLSQFVKSDGTHVRNYRCSGSDKVVLTTEDLGCAHTEKFNYGNGEVTVKKLPNEVTVIYHNGWGEYARYNEKTCCVGKKKQQVSKQVYTKSGCVYYEEKKGINDQYASSLKVYVGDEGKNMPNECYPDHPEMMLNPKNYTVEVRNEDKNSLHADRMLLEKHDKFDACYLSQPYIVSETLYDRNLNRSIKSDVLHRVDEDLNLPGLVKPYEA